MNNLYNWHDDWMSELKQREISKELEQIRLIREAASKGQGWLTTTKKALSSVLASWHTWSRAVTFHHHVRHPHRRPLAH